MGSRSVRNKHLVSAVYAVVVAFVIFASADLLKLILYLGSGIATSFTISVAFQFAASFPFEVGLGFIAVGLAGSSDRLQRRFGFAAISFGVALFLSFVAAAIVLWNDISMGFLPDRQLAAFGLRVIYPLLQVIAAPIAAVGFFRAAKRGTSAFMFRDKSLGWVAILLAVAAFAYAASDFLLATLGSNIGPSGLIESFNVIAGASLITAFGWIVAAIAFFNAQRAAGNSTLGGIGRRDGLIAVSAALALLGLLGLVVGEAIYATTLRPNYVGAVYTESWLRVIGTGVEVIAAAYVSMAFWRSYRGQMPRAWEAGHDGQ
jgi:hypothetical protein